MAIWQPDTIRVSDDNADCRNAVAHHPSRIAKKRPWVNGEFIRKDAWCSFAVPLFVVDRILAHVIFCFFGKWRKFLRIVVPGFTRKFLLIVVAGIVVAGIVVALRIGC